MMNQTAIEFRRNTVEPSVCLKAGWTLIRDQYWLFVGISLVGILVGSIVPFAILLGPMMCGVYLSMFKKLRGESVEFGNLFKGFDYFAESIVATLLHMVPMIVILVPFYIFFYVGVFLMMADKRQRGGEPDPAKMFAFFAVFGVFWLVFALVMIVLSVLFTFAYPLIVDRKLSGIAAVKLSMKAGLANFWRLLGLMLLNGLLALLGLLLCYVGMFLILPVTFAAIATAYEQVFGMSHGLAPVLPPPPPSFSRMTPEGL